MKLLLWAVIALVVVLWFLHNKKTRMKSDAARPSGRESSTEPILQCATCGMHIPKSEALINPAGLVFCSDEHRNKHKPS